MKTRLEWTAEEIRALRDWARLSRKEMADALEVSEAAVHRWEHEKRKPLMRAKRALDMLAEREAFEV